MKATPKAKATVVVVLIREPPLIALAKIAQELSWNITRTKIFFRKTGAGLVLDKLRNNSAFANHKHLLENEAC